VADSHTPGLPATSDTERVGGSRAGPLQRYRHLGINNHHWDSPPKTVSPECHVNTQIGHTQRPFGPSPRSPRWRAELKCRLPGRQIGYGVAHAGTRNFVVRTDAQP